MNGDFIRSKGLFAVAVGAGLMVGAAGVYLYQHFFVEKRRALLQQDINKLSLSVSEIRKELNALRSLYLKQRSSRASGAQSTDIETEMLSATGAEDIEDEFYDFSSDTELVADEEEKDSSFDEIDFSLDASAQEEKTKAYENLLLLLEKNSEDEDILWRLAKACHLLASMYGAEGDSEKKREFIFKGVEYGEKALQINSSNWKAHKWYAVCVGARGQLQPVKDKLRDGHLFKEHVDAAISINPNDATLHHLLGRFNFEVAGLSWIEKKLASTLFGDVPQGTYKAAITSLLEAEEQNATPWKENRLLLAKCYAAEEDFSQALHWLDLASEVQASTTEDQLNNAEIETLLKQFKKYRTLE